MNAAGANTVCKSRNSFADALTRPLHARADGLDARRSFAVLHYPLVTLSVRAQSAREFVTEY